MITLYAAAAAVEVADRDIDSLLDAWHDAVATADEEVFFGSLWDDAVYLGTDPGVRWTKNELMEWSKAHFGNVQGIGCAGPRRRWLEDQALQPGGNGAQRTHSEFCRHLRRTAEGERKEIALILEKLLTATSPENAARHPDC
jgi:hypothetical protein